MVFFLFVDGLVRNLASEIGGVGSHRAGRRQNVICGRGRAVEVLVVDVVERERFAELRAEKRLTLDGRVQEEIRGVVETGGEELQEGRVALLFGLFDELVDLFLARDQQRVHDFFVEERGAARGRREHPQDEQDLDLVVEREPGEEDVQECLECGEESEHDPVHHPFYLLGCHFVVVVVNPMNYSNQVYRKNISLNP